MIAVLQQEGEHERAGKDDDPPSYGGGQRSPGNQRIAGKQDEAQAVHAGIGSEVGQEEVIDLRVAERIPRHLGEPR